MELGGPGQARRARSTTRRREASWLEPIPDGRVLPDGRRPGRGRRRRGRRIRLAFVAALQHLPPQQRAVLILREVLGWRATEVAELLDTTVASVNSALQRARATLDASRDPRRATRRAARRGAAGAARSATSTRSSATTWTRSPSLLHEDATLSMPPYELWLLDARRHPSAGASGPGRLPRARGSSRPSRTARRRSASTGPAAGGGIEPWALQVLELSDGPDRRVHVVPRHRAALPALRPAADAARVGPRSRPTKAISSCSSREALTTRKRAPSRRALTCARASAFAVVMSARQWPTSQST